ncbi:hypothetical protein AMAG_06843 [Allomyces macrogynus ATCC 38327]|uniref:C2 domain-containing protein n=1 Tax=Allomyces macrogynus (strain ATCC 38327) TaxID=578462 RepID=A0A0L0SEW9_ALLM3|nr:hypothetical protein AMAG_06843 [Allomyces macrogynus ATCC 38327]|eukprot:KNE61088.1 hypothetical protein AMAG_06843 [Allomyces macrogynus ATCC 38327]
MSAANLGQSAPGGAEKPMGGPAGPTKSPLNDLAALRRVLMAEENSRPSVTGILSVKIKQIHILELKEAQLIYSKCFATMSIRTLTKKTDVTRKENGVLHWNQTKQFPVVVRTSLIRPALAQAPVQIQILEVSSTDPTRTFLIGSVSFHVHDIHGMSPVAGIFDLWDQHRFVGDVSLEITFNYGSFGYGYSPQEGKRVPEDMITYSLFQRINPPEDQMESVDGVMAVKAVPHPSYSPFTEKVYLSYGKELGDFKGMPDKQYVPDFVARDLSHLKAICDQYFAMTDRVASLFLLKQLTSPNLRPETVLDANDAVPPAPRVDPKFVQPFSLAPMVKDEVVFQALAKNREARRNGNGPPPSNASAGMPSSSSRGSTSGLMYGGPKRRSVNFHPGAVVERRKKWVDDMITFKQPEDAVEEGEDA